MTVIARCVVAILVGLLTVVVLNLAIDAVHYALNPAPQGRVADLPPTPLTRMQAIWVGSLAGLCAAAAFGAVAGSWLAARMGVRSYTAHGFVVGAILAVAAIQAILIAGHPFLVLSVAIVALPLCVVVGRRLALRRSTTQSRG